MTLLRALWDFIVAVGLRVGNGHFGLIAAGVAFFAMFAVFPGLAAAVAVWSIFADPGVIKNISTIPDDKINAVYDALADMLATVKAAA